MQELASVSGPALAGVLLAVGGSHLVYVVQAFSASAVFCAFWLLKLRARPEPEVAAVKVPAIQALVEGVRFVWRDKLILPAISLDLFAVLFGGATALLPIYAVEILHGGVHALAWLRAAPAIGAVAMALTTAHLPRVKSAGRMMLWGVAGFGVATIVFAVSKIVLVVVRDVDFDGRVRQHQRGAAAESGADRDAGPCARARAGGEQHFHQLFESVGRGGKRPGGRVVWRGAFGGAGRLRYARDRGRFCFAGETVAALDAVREATVQSAGALSGRQRSSLVPWRKRPPLKWS